MNNLLGSKTMLGIRGGVRWLSVSMRRPCEFVTDHPGITVQQNYRNRKDESLEQKRARLLYQSRKRGMLENGLLLSTFAHKHLDDMSAGEMEEYDKIINLPSNDWDLYYWMMGVKETPVAFNNAVMDMLKSHARNDDRELRLRQPDLKC